MLPRNPTFPLHPDLTADPLGSYSPVAPSRRAQGTTSVLKLSEGMLEHVQERPKAPSRVGCAEVGPFRPLDCTEGGREAPRQPNSAPVCSHRWWRESQRQKQEMAADAAVPAHQPV